MNTKELSINSTQDCFGNDVVVIETEIGLKIVIGWEQVGISMGKWGQYNYVPRSWFEYKTPLEILVDVMLGIPNPYKGPLPMYCNIPITETP